MPALSNATMMGFPKVIAATLSPSLGVPALTSVFTHRRLWKLKLRGPGTSELTGPHFDLAQRAIRWLSRVDSPHRT